MKKLCLLAFLLTGCATFHYTGTGEPSVYETPLAETSLKNFGDTKVTKRVEVRNPLNTPIAVYLICNDPNEPNPEGRIELPAHTATTRLITARAFDAHVNVCQLFWWEPMAR